MIINAKDFGLQTGGLPQVGEVLPNWFQDLKFAVMRKVIEDYEVKEIFDEITTKGVRQPMTAQQLAIKPEGQRAWRWETLHCLPDVDLKIDDVVIFDNIRYRVMQRWNWKEYGYMQYEICEGYDE